MYSKLFPRETVLSIKDIIDINNQKDIDKINEEKDEDKKIKLSSKLLTEEIIFESISKYNKEDFFSIDKMDSDFKHPLKIFEYLNDKMVFEINEYRDIYFYLFFKFFVKKDSNKSKILPFKTNFKTLEAINRLKFFDIRYVEPKDSSLLFLNPNKMDKINFGMHSITVEKPYSFEMLSCLNCNKYAYLLSMMHNQKIKFEETIETLSGFYIHHNDKFNRLYSLIKKTLKDFVFIDEDYYNEIIENMEKSLSTIKDILTFKKENDIKNKSCYGKKIYFYNQDESSYIHLHIIPSISTIRHFNLNFFDFFKAREIDKDLKDINVRTHRFHIIGSNENTIGTNSFKSIFQLECAFPRFNNKNLNKDAEYILTNNSEKIIDFLIKEEVVNLDNHSLKIYETYKEKKGINLRNSFEKAMNCFVSDVLFDLNSFFDYVISNDGLYSKLDNIENNIIKNFFKLRANSKELNEIMLLIIKTIISKKTFKLNNEIYLLDDDFISCLKNTILSFIKNI